MRYYKLTLYKIVESRQNHIESNESDERRRYVRSSCPSITAYDLESSGNESSKQDNSNEFSIYGAEYKKKEEPNDESNQFYKVASRFIVITSQYLIITGVGALTMNPLLTIATTITLLVLENIIIDQVESLLKSEDKVEFEVIDDDKEEEAYQGLDSQVNSKMNSEINSEINSEVNSKMNSEVNSRVNSEVNNDVNSKANSYIVNQILQKSNLATDNNSGYHAFEAHRINKGDEVSHDIEDRDIKELV